MQIKIIVTQYNGNTCVNKKNYCLQSEASALKVRKRLTQLWNRKCESAKS